ncbi:MAG: hypothetical protein GY841_04630, partial [FCB group bacterium]|nr:hypothetical protein [FCB group bacterium]
MQYLSVKNLEKYQPGYKDRTLIWCKVYFKMINADPDFEMLCEIDKWRFIAFAMLEIQTKKPVPLDSEYLRRKGFDLKKRPISLTIQMLHNSVEVRNENVTQIRIEKSRVDKNRIEPDKDITPTASADAETPPPQPVKQAKKPPKEKPPPLTDGARAFLRLFSAKRFANRAQRRAVLEL